MVTICDAQSMVLVSCYGEPHEYDNKIQHNGRIYEGMTFLMHPDYVELKNPDEPMINVFASDKGELSIIYINHLHNQTKVYAYHEDHKEDWKQHIKDLKGYGWS